MARKRALIRPSGAPSPKGRREKTLASPSGRGRAEGAGEGAPSAAISSNAGSQRRAALNLMEDAVQARQTTEKLNQELREVEARFRGLADNIPQLAWIADAGTSGQVHWFNRNWLDYTGATLEQMNGQGWHQVHHPDHAERVIQKFAYHVEHGLDWEDTFPLRGKDGSYRWFLSRMKVLRDPAGKIAWIFGTNTDITEQRQMVDELAAAARRKDDFLATLAHELRGPLAPLSNALQIAQRANDGAMRQQALGLAGRQLQQMVRLIDDLLDASRISRDKLTLQLCDVELAPVVQQALETCRPAMDSAGHEVTVTLPPQPVYLRADSARLAQVLCNLLTNACKYTVPGGRISLIAEAHGAELVVRVKDNGIGIAPEMLPRIFELFTQAPQGLERAQGGLGIGLSLVQRLVEMHGGTVEARSDGIGAGSEFVMRLPVVQDISGAKTLMPPEKIIADENRSAAHSILVVDDNRDSALSLASWLDLSGHQTHTVFDGLEAVAAAEQFRPDVVLMDLGMPNMNGYEAAQKIREQSWGKSMMLVALTGWGQDDDRRRSKEAGFNLHLVKPVDNAALSKLLAELPLSAVL